MNVNWKITSVAIIFSCTVTQMYYYKVLHYTFIAIFIPMVLVGCVVTFICFFTERIQKK